MLGKNFLIAESQGEIVRNPISNHQNPKWSSVKSGKPWTTSNLCSTETNVKSDPDNGEAYSEGK